MTYLFLFLAGYFVGGITVSVIWVMAINNLHVKYHEIVNRMAQDYEREYHG